jgi:uncharacterized protein (DUF1330 family)
MTVYAIAQGTITDRDAFDRYLAQSGPTLLAHGARLLAVDEQPTAVEGEIDHPRTVIIAFDSAEQFYRWYDSAEYRAARQARESASRGRFLLVQGF